MCYCVHGLAFEKEENLPFPVKLFKNQRKCYIAQWQFESLEFSSLEVIFS